jgi:acetyl esterase/lipase
LTGARSRCVATGPTAKPRSRHYLGDAIDPRHPYVSPLFVPDLSGLPPALVVTMEFDPHRDEAEAYGRHLVEAGVTTVQRRFLGHVHGSAMFTALMPRTGTTSSSPA